jgi:hypothetical protein
VNRTLEYVTIFYRFPRHFVECLRCILCIYCRLGDVVFSMLATGLKGLAAFEPGQGDRFLRAIKSAAHLPSDGK